MKHQKQKQNEYNTADKDFSSFYHNIEKKKRKTLFPESITKKEKKKKTLAPLKISLHMQITRTKTKERERGDKNGEAAWKRDENPNQCPRKAESLKSAPGVEAFIKVPTGNERRWCQSCQTHKA